MKNLFNQFMVPLYRGVETFFKVRGHRKYDVQCSAVYWELEEENLQPGLHNYKWSLALQNNILINPFKTMMATNTIFSLKTYPFLFLHILLLVNLSSSIFTERIYHTVFQPEETPSK